MKTKCTIYALALTLTAINGTQAQSPSGSIVAFSVVAVALGVVALYSLWAFWPSSGQATSWMCENSDGCWK